MTETTLPIKPAITLGDDKPGLIRRFLDLLWFIRLWFSATPGVAWFWVAALIAAGATTTAQLWLARAVIDSVQSEPARTTWIFTGLTIAIVALDQILGNRCYVASQIIRERGIPFLQATILRKSTEVSLEAYESQQFYDVASRLAKDLETKADSHALYSIPEILRTAPTLIGSLVLLWVIDWRAALLIPLPGIPGMIIMFAFGERFWGFVRDQTRDVRIAGYLAEQLAARQPAKEVRLFGLQNLLLARWSHHYLATRRDVRRERFRNQLRGQIPGNILSLLPFIVVFWLVFESGASFTLGDILVLVTLQMAIGSDMNNVAVAIHRLAEFSGFATDVRALNMMPAIFATSLDVVSSPPVRRGGITFEHVSYRYPGSTTKVLDDLSFVIEPGQHVAIVGENGAGKTTLIKLALGLYEPDEGQILLDGVPLEDIPVAERQTLFSAVFQHFTRYPLTVEENLILHRADFSGNVDTALQTVHMQQAISQLPKGTDTILSPDLGGTDLSGGQWQRLAIARAGLRNAAVLALDEPTAALDPMAEVAIFQRFNQISEGRTTLLVSHRLGMARLAERILVIEQGKLVEDDSHRALLSQNGVYANLWHVQSRWYL